MRDLVTYSFYSRRDVGDTLKRLIDDIFLEIKN